MCPTVFCKDFESNFDKLYNGERINEAVSVDSLFYGF